MPPSSPSGKCTSTNPCYPQYTIDYRYQSIILLGKKPPSSVINNISRNDNKWRFLTHKESRRKLSPPSNSDSNPPLPPMLLEYLITLLWTFPLSKSDARELRSKRRTREKKSRGRRNHHRRNQSELLSPQQDVLSIQPLDPIPMGSTSPRWSVTDAASSVIS